MDDPGFWSGGCGGIMGCVVVMVEVRWVMVVVNKRTCMVEIYGKDG